MTRENMYMKSNIALFEANKFEYFKHLDGASFYTYRVNGLDQINASHIMLCRCMNGDFMAVFLGVDGLPFEEKNSTQGVVMPLTDRHINEVWTYHGLLEPAPYDVDEIKLYELIDLAVMMWHYGFEQEQSKHIVGFSTVGKENVE